MKEIELTGDVLEPMDPDCMDTHYFVLKLDEAKFAMSLENVLGCLKFAEKEGIVPEITDRWWSRIYNTYPRLAEPVEVDD